MENEGGVRDAIHPHRPLFANIIVVRRLRIQRSYVAVPKGMSCILPKLSTQHGRAEFTRLKFQLRAGRPGTMDISQVRWVSNGDADELSTDGRRQNHRSDFERK